MLTTLVVVAVLLAIGLVVADLMSRLPRRLPIHGPVDEGPFRFPPGFFWGTATADHQVETAAPDDWTAFERQARLDKKQGRRPDGNVERGHIHNIATIAESWIDNKTNFNLHHGTDLALAKSLGNNAFRFSISWARLFPRADMTEADPEGLAFYDSLFDHLEKQGLEPFVTLFHFASPAWLWTGTDAAGKRGLEREDAVAHFEQFTRVVAHRYGQRVKYWCTLNEPMVWTFFGYLEGVFPPHEQRAGGPKEVVDVVANLLRMHAGAYQIIKALRHDAQVGIAHHIRHFIPYRNWWPFDRLTSVFVDQAFTLDFLDAIESGSLRVTFTGRTVDIPGLKGTQDYVGLNYYGRFYVKSNFPPKFEILPHDKNEPGEEPNDLGWAIDESSFPRELVRFHQRYGKPLFILETGIADKDDDDVRRQHFIVRHTQAMWQAMQAGADVKGFFFWSLLDNFEWCEGFDARFGLVKVDYDTGARTRRPSADVYADIAGRNAISAALWSRLRRKAPPFGRSR